MRAAELALSIARTDRTFARAEVRGQAAWVGKCLHCRSRLVIDDDGTTGRDVTIEHIVPRNKGGTDALQNLALACARCNHQKGRRIDVLDESDPRYASVVEKLLAERKKRWREPEMT